MKNEKTNIVLCGFMGSGKTSIGQPLATALGYDYIDTDQLLVATFQQTISDMFAEHGEDYFRDREHDIAKLAASMERTVISTGGGLMTFDRNAKALAQTGTVIYLEPGFETCYQRICHLPDRPLVQKNTKEGLEQLYNSRVEPYKKYASFTLGNTPSVNEAVQLILEFLHRQ